MESEEKNYYLKHWPGLEGQVKYLVCATEGYIVFLDHENDVDWKSKDSYDDANKDKIHTPEYFSAKNKIDLIECLPVNDLELKAIISFKRLIGEAVVRMLDGHFEQAVEIAKRAKQYLLQRKFEIARYEILKVGGISTIVLLVAAFILWLIKDFAIGLLGLNFYTILLASLFGGVGAYLSVIQRIGNQNIDYNSPKYLLQLEGISRSTAGIISAIIVCLAFKLGIVLTILSQGSHSLLAMIFGSILAGYSERLAPSIVKSVEDTTDSSGLGPGQ